MKSRCLLLFNIAVVFCWVEVGAQRSEPSGYWQQHINYNIEVDMNVETSQYEGRQRVVYTNNSPDKLVRAFFHLYFNAFQPGSMMDVRSRSLPDPDRRVMDRISKLNKNEIGFHEIKKIILNDQDIYYYLVNKSHNNANILALPARFISEKIALKCLDAFLNQKFEGGRHLNRVNKINC